MKISIMQPTFLPWVGYFKMMILSDLFIFLDDVQFERRSFQSRNKLIVGNNEKLISIPVHVKNRYDQLINQVEINYESNWIDSHLKTIYFNYSKHKYFNEIFEIIEKNFRKENKKLIDLNMNIINEICRYLNIDTKFKLSSTFNIKKKKSDKILNLILESGGKQYFTPLRTRDYLKDGKIFEQNGIELFFFKYDCKAYNQKNSNKFISHLSIVDLLFNQGKEAINYL